MDIYKMIEDVNRDELLLRSQSESVMTRKWDNQDSEEPESSSDSDD